VYLHIMYLLTGASDEIVRAASVLMTPRPAEVVYEMVEDDSIGDVMVSYKASIKTPLRRMAEFHLRIISG